VVIVLSLYFYFTHSSNTLHSRPFKLYKWTNKYMHSQTCPCGHLY
jgi:hypothetical protein